MGKCPEDLYYIDTHQWARPESDGTATVGITDHAQEALGDVVYVELPKVGDVVTSSSQTGIVESVKAASDVFAPLSGKVIAINERLIDQPESINDDPYGEGWFYRLELSDAGQIASLMSASAYSALLQG